MRVTTGRFKGRTLKTVNDLSVRPATDRVKQTIFNMLMNRIELDGADVLDLYAGSGSLGIEALSRGARHTTFVETDRRVAEYIEKNLQLLNCVEETEVFQYDALAYLHATHSSFDIIFADPPYDYAKTSQIPDIVFSLPVLNLGGYLIIEHSTAIHFSSSDLYEAGPVKKFGRTIVTFFQHPAGKH